MNTLTKEWLQKTIAELEEERDATPGAVNEDAAKALAAMKIALASLEAEPVFEVEVSGNHWLNAGPVDDSDFSGMPDGVNQLYSAPPVPLSMPAAYEHTEDFSEYHEGWNACRAAMLQDAENAETPTTMQAAPALDSSPKIAESPTGINQGKSEPVTTANKLPFEQWLSQQTGTIDVECGCVMTEVFFHWLRVAYEAGNSPVVLDGACPCCGRKQLKNRTCSVSGCDGKHVAHGFCKKHYDIERKKDPSRRESIRAADKRYRARKAAAPQQEA